MYRWAVSKRRVAGKKEDQQEGEIKAAYVRVGSIQEEGSRKERGPTRGRSRDLTYSKK
jgi:hypothetical protein